MASSIPHYHLASELVPALRVRCEAIARVAKGHGRATATPTVKRTSPALLEEIDPSILGKALAKVLCITPGLRRRGYIAQASIPTPSGAQVTQCATSSEAYALVDAGFGYALVPSLYTMPDPYHRILRWKGSPNVRYGFYHRADARDDLTSGFANVAIEVYSWSNYARPLSENWQP